MENKKPKSIKTAVTGAASGFINGLFGSGGGIIAVMLLRREMSDMRRAHATATLMIFVISIVSVTLYAATGYVDFSVGLKLMPGGLAGAAVGAALLRKIKPSSLRRLFGLIMVVSGVVMLLR